MFRTRAAFITAWLISLVLVGMFASAQVRQELPGTIQPPFMLLNAPTVFAGNDVGFRVDDTDNGIPVGKLVVRINGRWVEAQLGTAGVVPAGTK